MSNKPKIAIIVSSTRATRFADIPTAWIKAKADSEVNGKLVEKVESVFLKPTDYSPIK